MMAMLRLLILSCVIALSFISLSPAFAQPSPSSADDSSESVVRTSKSFHEAIAPALRWTQEGSWQPPQGEISLGISELRWSPWEKLSLHVWTLPLTFVGLNLGARGSIYSTERWTIGAELRGMTIDIGRFQQKESDSGEAPQILVSPFSLYGSYLITPKLVAGLSFHHTAISVTGGVNEGADVSGVAVSTNRHLRAHLGWALSESWSLWWVVNRMIYQGVGGSVISTIPLQGGGSLTIYGSAEKGIVEPGQNANRFLLSYRGDLFSWSTGFATGMPPVYILGSVAKQLKFLPYFDLSLRW